MCAARAAIAPQAALAQAALAKRVVRVEHAVRTFALMVLLIVLLAAANVVVQPLSAFAAVDDLGNEVNPHQLPDSSFIYDASIAELAGADAYLDGQIVQVAGEAVGDNIHADADGSYSWITLMANDDSDTVITVYMAAHFANMVDTFGRYGATGTTLQVRGTFNLACSEHEGLSDVHAEDVSVVRKGSVQHESFDLRRFIPGAVFAGLGLVLMLVFYFLRERLR